MDTKEAFEGFKDSVLRALDDGYSDGMSSEEVIGKVSDFIKQQDLYKERPDFMDEVMGDIFNEWREDRGIPQVAI